MVDDSGAVAARAYLLALRAGDPPTVEPVLEAHSPDSATTALAPSTTIGVDDMLELTRSDEGLQLRGGVDRRAYAQLVDAQANAVCARSADEHWRIAAEATDGSWQIVARTLEDDSAVGAYYPAGATRGDIWLGPDL